MINSRDKASEAENKIKELINELIAVGCDFSILKAPTFRQRTYKRVKKLIDKLN